MTVCTPWWKRKAKKEQKIRRKWRNKQVLLLGAPRESNEGLCVLACDPEKHESRKLLGICEEVRNNGGELKLFEARNPRTKKRQKIERRNHEESKREGKWVVHLYFCFLSVPLACILGK